MQAKLIAAVLAVMAMPAYAQSPEPVRYQLISVSGGFVRLDTVSGVMTFCRDEVDDFHCSPVPADSATAGIQPETGAIPRKEDDSAGANRADDGSDRDRSEMRDRRGFREDSSVENFDRALSMMEKAMRSFMAISKESSKETPRDCAL
jgi:hypothetical protein